jgi:hypothetical protein
MTAAAYDGSAALSLVTELGVGHSETPSMRRAVLDFFKMHL